MGQGRTEVEGKDALKKSDTDEAVALRFYETAGSPAETPVGFLGQRRSFQEVNLLEEQAQEEQQVTAVAPHEINIIKMRVQK